jgi:hypothetical protein
MNLPPEAQRRIIERYPVIASLNGVSGDGWLKLEHAGAAPSRQHINASNHR